MSLVSIDQAHLEQGRFTAAFEELDASSGPVLMHDALTG